MKNLDIAVAKATSPSGRTRYWLEVLGRGPVTASFATEAEALKIVAPLRTRRDFRVTETVVRKWNQRPLER